MARKNTAELINDVLKEHSVQTGDWSYREQARILHEWAERFNAAFDLGLQTPAIRLDRIRTRALGTYQPGRNGFGLRHEITLNTLYLDRALVEQLKTLLHELIHEWQDLYGRAGRGNYHNRQFRNKALLYGLMVDERGYDVGIRPGPFTNLLSRYEVETKSLRAPEENVFRVRLQGNSKMRKYRCGCTTVRCATELMAYCNRCGLRFEEAPSSW